jgi:hypothetical protein
VTPLSATATGRSEVPQKAASRLPFSANTANGPTNAQREMRQTIIGVAAPANEPPAEPLPLNEQREMRQTIIGVAAPANEPRIEPVQTAADMAEPSEPVPFELASQTCKPVEALGSSSAAGAGLGKLEDRLAHKATIQGLSPVLSRPAQPDAVRLGVPTEPMWNVVIPRHGAVEMSEPDIVRAFAEGKLNRDTLVWREGVETDWKPIAEVEPLRAQFRRAGLSLSPPTDAPGPLPARPSHTKPSAIQSRLPKPNVSDTDSPMAKRRSVRPYDKRPSKVATLVPISTRNLPSFVPDLGEPEEVTRVQASPWQVPDAGADATERLASSAGLPPRRSTSAQFRSSGAPSAEEPTRQHAFRPAAVGPQDTLSDQTAPQLSLSPSPEISSDSAIRVLGPEPSMASTATPSVAAPREPPRRPRVISTPTSPPKTPDSTTIDKRYPQPSSAPTSEARRTRKHRWVWPLLAVAVLGGGTLSYRTRQPHIAYAYLHRIGWDARIDRAAHEAGAALRSASENYVVKPYRAIARKLRHAPTR